MMFPEKSGSENRVLKPILLPTETSLNSMNTILVDTYGEEAELENTEAKIRSASSIVLVYDITSGDSAERLSSHWLPIIEATNPSVPVIVVGNKLDKVRTNYELSYHTRVGKIIRKLVREHSQVQMGLDCSSKDSKNVIETLYCAQCMVQYPLRPLLNQSDRTLTAGYERALARIFRILDADCDGVLNDNELCSLQELVFGSALAQRDLKGLKDVIREESPLEISSRGVTLKGFYMINKRMLEMMKIKNCWLVLRYFGYNDDLELSLSNFRDQLLGIQNGASVELSFKSLQFLKKLFVLNSISGTSLSREDIDNVFATMSCI